MEGLLKNVLRALVETLEDSPEVGKDGAGEEHSEMGTHGAGEEHINCDEYELMYTTQSADKKALETVSGKYYGSAFVSSKSGEHAIVPGELTINGLKEPLKSNFTFTSVRYIEKGMYHEELKVHTKHGACTADALYKDADKEEDLIEGNAVLSTTEYADYLVETSTGELRDFKGHYLRIHFDNKGKCRPRRIELIPGPGPDKKNAAIGEWPVCEDNDGNQYPCEE